MTALRVALFGFAIMLAVVLQGALLPIVEIGGVVPNIALLVVVAAALARGGEFAMVLGFAAGALLDLAPPADHTAGRWALALIAVGYLAGRVRRDAAQSVLATLATVAATSFVATSIFAFSGLLLRDPGLSGAGVLGTILISVGYDTFAAVLVIPALLWVFRRAEAQLQVA